MIIASHQIDLLPYPGFWDRVNRSNIMDLGGLYDWFNKGSDYYHHRVKIGHDDNWKWLTLPIETHTGYRNIDVKVKNDLLYRCYEELEKVYSKSLNWDLYKDDLNSIFSYRYDKMWKLNFELLLWMRDKLGIKTPLSISSDPGLEGTATDKILYQLKEYSNDSIIYYCGKGGKEYLELDKLNHSGIEVQFQDFKLPINNYRTVSTLSLMMDFDIDTVRSYICQV